MSVKSDSDYSYQMFHICNHYYTGNDHSVFHHPNNGNAHLLVDNV